MKAAYYGFASVVLAGALLALGQDYYYPPPYGEYYHSSTAAEGALRGMGALARSAGEYNLLSSQAAINLTEAQKKFIENRDQWTNTYFQMREANRMYRAEERGKRPTMEAMVRYAQAGKPKPLSPSELDSVTGKIKWPVLLQADRFASDRKKLDAVFAKRAEQGTLGLEDQIALRKTTDAMLDGLRAQLRKGEVPQMNYIAAKRFVESLAYEGSASS